MHLGLFTAYTSDSFPHRPRSSSPCSFLTVLIFDFAHFWKVNQGSQRHLPPFLLLWAPCALRNKHSLSRELYLTLSKDLHLLLHLHHIFWVSLWLCYMVNILHVSDLRDNVRCMVDDYWMASVKSCGWWSCYFTHCVYWESFPWPCVPAQVRDWRCWPSGSWCLLSLQACFHPG